MVESERDYKGEEKQEREEHKALHAQFMELRQAPVEPRDEPRGVATEFVAINGILSKVCIQFDTDDVVISPEDDELELFRNVYNTNEEYFT